MCGRYIVVTKIKEIEKKWGLTSPMGFTFTPTANLAPGQMGLVVTQQQPREIQVMRFGFTPYWSKDGKMFINARSEGDHNLSNDRYYHGAKGIIDKPSFRKPIRSQRCWVIADGFIEGPEKLGLSQPFCVYPKKGDGPMLLAGVWDVYQRGEVQVYSFAIVTTAGNEVMHRIGHHRCPLVLDKETAQIWIDDSSTLSDVTQCMQVPKDEWLNAYPIDVAIKSPANNGKEVLRPLGEPLFKDFDYEFYQDIEMFGMGESRARKRRDDQMTLF
jgi:putative SOS response-associated peptidase YedK